jgi:hypothetical protein
VESGDRISSSVYLGSEARRRVYAKVEIGLSDLDHHLAKLRVQAKPTQRFSLQIGKDEDAGRPLFGEGILWNLNAITRGEFETPNHDHSL